MQEISAFVRRLQLILGAMLTGLAVFTGVVYTLVSPEDPATQNDDLTLLYVLVAVIFGSLTGANFVSRMMLQKARSLPSLQAKLNQFQMAFLVRIGMIDGAAFFGLACYLITARMTFLMAALMLMAAMVLTAWPSESRIKTELEL